MEHALGTLVGLPLAFGKRPSLADICLVLQMLAAERSKRRAR